MNRTPLDSIRKNLKYARLFGWWKGTSLQVREWASPRSQEVHVNAKSLRYPVILRTRDSDIRTFEKIFGLREYDIQSMPKPSVIVDAGANIGLATIFFADRYPSARIIALEPEADNFSLLVRNTVHYPNVTCVRKALWPKSGKILLIDPGIGHWGFRTAQQISPVPSESGAGEVDCISVPDLMEEFGLSSLGLLKLDIEGAEKEVMESALPWIDRVQVVVAELHDRFKRGCSLAFYDATRSFDEEVHRGENVFVLRRT